MAKLNRVNFITQKHNIFRNIASDKVTNWRPGSGTSQSLQKHYTKTRCFKTNVFAQRGVP